MAITENEVITGLTNLSTDELLELSQNIDADLAVKRCIDSILGHAIGINK